VYYIFYEYFFKAAISKGTWKQHLTGSKRFGTNFLEAYALAIIKNNYFTWLYNYKSKHPGSTLQMEYDLPLPRNMYDNDSDKEENNKEKTNDNNATPTFCGDLDMVKIVRECKGMDFEYHLVLDLSHMEAQYKKCKKT
jgi:hypothetical protein